MPWPETCHDEGRERQNATPPPGQHKAATFGNVQIRSELISSIIGLLATK